jgi:hypothetical protein
MASGAVMWPNPLPERESDQGKANAGLPRDRPNSSSHPLPTVTPLNTQHRPSRRHEHAPGPPATVPPWDPGSEMRCHGEVTSATGMTVSDRELASPWQRALDENANGLRGQYFPKERRPQPQEP